MQKYLLLFTGLALAASAAPGREAAETDNERLQGAWAVASVQTDGKVQAGTGPPRLVIRGGRFHIEESGRKTAEGTFRLDPTARPRACEVTEGGQTSLGIYDLDGDTLKVCLGDERPDRFEAAAGSGRVLLTCRRAPAGPKAAAIKEETARLRGTWALAFAIVEGKKSSDDAVRREGNRWAFAGDRVTIRRADQPGRPAGARYTIDPTASPGTIDLVPSAGPDRGKVCRGIYQLEKDSLTLCVAPPGSARPKDFSAPGGSGHVLTVYEREKP